MLRSSERLVHGPVSPEICADQAEAPVRHTLAGGRLGVSSRAAYLRTAVDAAFWLGIAPLPARILARAGARHAAAIAQHWWARGIARTLRLSIDYHGLEHIDPHATYVVTPLHEGFVDAIALLRLPLRPRFVVRDEFAGWPLLGAYLRDTGQIAIRPEDGAAAYRQIIRSARQVFAGGESLIIFPQGSILGIETDFFSGAFALARGLNRPILPIAITGSHRVWEHPFSPRLRRGERISVRVLPPIPVEDVCARNLDDLRTETRDQLKSAALDGTMAQPRRFVPARDGYWDGFCFEIDPAFPEIAAAVAARRSGRVVRGQMAHGASPDAAAFPM